jgi:hypothetical protein
LVGDRNRLDDNDREPGGDRPPMVPRAPPSPRNWSATCRRRAPSERRSPISGTRSSTATSVVLAMPTAPTTRQIATRSRNRLDRSVLTPSRSWIQRGNRAEARGGVGAKCYRRLMGNDAGRPQLLGHTAWTAARI